MHRRWHIRGLMAVIALAALALTIGGRLIPPRSQSTWGSIPRDEWGRMVEVAPSATSAHDPRGRVVGISDGDTLTVLVDKTRVKIRLHGIDAPEAGQAFGGKAKQLASDLAFGKVVRFTTKDTDRYGRTVAEVTLPDGRSLNHELVREGLAWWYRKYAPNDGTLERLERVAREEKRGLWANATPPVAPWFWRANGGRDGAAPAGRKSGSEIRSR